ncbi:MAG: hypothetical protein K2G88_09555, partial [Oscillospiraceae bacterium]|nr:hypothetical protein [Oscillospiraceae bacterium]
MIFLKILFWILIIFLLVFMIICLSSVVIKINFQNEKFQWSVQYFGFQILPFKKNRKFLSKSGKNKKKPKSKEKNYKLFVTDKFLKLLQRV